jgi:hypothetical protein
MFLMHLNGEPIGLINKTYAYFGKRIYPLCHAQYKHLVVISALSLKGLTSLNNQIDVLACQGAEPFAGESYFKTLSRSFAATG